MDSGRLCAETAPQIPVLPTVASASSCIYKGMSGPGLDVGSVEGRDIMEGYL